MQCRGQLTRYRESRQRKTKLCSQTQRSGSLPEKMYLLKIKNKEHFYDVGFVSAERGL